MSDSEHQDPLKSLDDFLDNEELKNEMESLDDLIRELQDEEVAAPVQTPEPTIRWTKRDIDGNIIYSRPRSSRNQSNEVGELILPWMRLTLAMSWPLLQRLLSVFYEISSTH
ncbi:hypothetical protein NQZ68_007107 [Dissostichus eleginoides]|nr:hypothetical protein NQZ68_007107 [Dissostichus eleginoides]